MAPTGEINIWRGFAADNPAQMDFLYSPAKYRLLSSGRGGGKSVVGCRESIRVAVEHPGSRNVIARLKSTELERTTHKTFKRELRMIGFVPGVHYVHNKNDSTYYWLNGPDGGMEGGSETVFSHMEDEEKFGSEEMSTIFVDEGSQVPDSIYQMLFPANLRWPVGPHRAWFCTNPGASGWLRDIVYGDAKGSGRAIEYRTASGRLERVVDEYAWFPVKPGWNRHNPGGQAYFDDLLRDSTRYGPHFKARYYDGDWDSFEGQRFTMFDRERHIMAAPFKPTPDYEIVEGWDFGHRETFVCWIAFKPKSNEPVVVFDELQVQEVMEPNDVAKRVKEIRARYGISDRVMALGDPAGAAASQFSAVGPISAFAALGIYIAPCRAGKSPTGRADLLSAFLTESRVQPDGSIWPGIVFGPNCPAVVRSILDLRWDTTVNTKGEDPREKFLKKGDHGFDALGYGLVGVPPPDMPAGLPDRPRPGVNISARDALRMAVGG